MITALNAAGGSKRWSEQFAEENDSITSVAAEGNMVYLVTEDGTVSALDAASGALRWCSRTQQLELSSSAGPIPLLTVAQGMVYVTQHGRFNAVTALDASNGSQRWQKPLGGASLYMFLNVQVDADLVVLTMLQLASTNGAVTSTSTLVALSASNGATRWSFQSQKGPFAPPLTLANGIAYVVEDVGSACPDTYIDAVHEQDGKLLWRAHQEGCGYIWPVSASGLVFTVPTCKCDSHKVYAFDGATGTQRWVATLSEVGSGPLVDAGVVYVVAGSGNGASQLQALQANSGRALWTWPGAYSVLAAANGVVYVSDSISLVALSSVGKLQWQAPDLGAPTLRLTLGL
jgi:outer membrane protein assembly factor BamB